MPWVVHVVSGRAEVGPQARLALSLPLSDSGTASPQMEGSVGRPGARVPHFVPGWTHDSSAQNQSLPVICAADPCPVKLGTLTPVS